MPTHIRHGRSPCPVARSLDVLGDKWTLLIIREALSGTTRFMDFSHQLPGLARTLLSQRLKRLIALGVFETIPVSQTGHYHEYVLTAMGHRWVCSSADGEPLAPEDTQTVVRGPDSVGD
jgi:DNA-binding HxlR family transcriptional regulator